MALIAVFLVVLASSATAASSAAVPACNRVASPAGRDSARGTLRSPYRTFKRLFQSLRPGMVGCLRGGSYGDGTTTQAIYHGGRPGQRMIISGYRNEKATIDGPVFISDTADYVTIRHITIEGATKPPAGERRLALEIWGRNFIFEDSVLTSHSGGRSGILLRGDRPLIRRNKIHDVGTVGSEFGYAHGIYVAESRGFKIERNWIYDCPVGWGVQLFPHAVDGVVAQNVIDGCGSGITITGDHTASSTHGNRIEHNLITNSLGLRSFNSGTGVAGCCEGSPDGNVVIGNVFWHNRGGAFDEWKGRSYIESRNVSLDPRYVNRAARDFRVRAPKARALGLWNGVFAR